jgi:trehalose/maltose hydrolase-like predicted phosphorylase
MLNNAESSIIISTPKKNYSKLKQQDRLMKMYRLKQHLTPKYIQMKVNCAFVGTVRICEYSATVTAAFAVSWSSTGGEQG